MIPSPIPIGCLFLSICFPSGDNPDDGISGSKTMTNYKNAQLKADTQHQETVLV